MTRQTTSRRANTRRAAALVATSAACLLAVSTASASTVVDGSFDDFDRSDVWHIGPEHAGPMPMQPALTNPIPIEPLPGDLEVEQGAGEAKSSVAFTPEPPREHSGNVDDPAKGGEQVSVQPRPTQGVTALSLLQTLRVEPPAYVDYERDDYSWRKDIDRNGCDTRNDILNRDLTNKTYKPGTRDCVVLTGDVHSLYTGQTYAFVRNPSNTDIDHVVALHNAHIMGAHQWPIPRKEEFANDPLNLLPSESSVNRKKSSLDASNWLPPNAGYHCGFVARQVAVKAKYSLAVQQRERDTMADVLGGCPGEPAPGFDDARPEPVKGSEVIVVGY